MEILGDHDLGVGMERNLPEQSLTPSFRKIKVRGQQLNRRIICEILQGKVTQLGISPLYHQDVKHKIKNY